MGQVGVEGLPPAAMCSARAPAQPSAATPRHQHAAFHGPALAVAGCSSATRSQSSLRLLLPSVRSCSLTFSHSQSPHVPQADADSPTQMGEIIGPGSDGGGGGGGPADGPGVSCAAGGGLDVAMAQHLLAAADLLQLERLRRIAERRLVECVEVDSVADTLALADKNHAEELKKVGTGGRGQGPRGRGGVM